MNSEWSNFVKDTRQLLGLKRPEFASLLAIAMPTLDSWEYLGVVPPPVYQYIIGELHKSAVEAKNQLKINKWKYVNAGHPQVGLANRNNTSFWKEVAKGAVAIGAILLIMEALSSNTNQSRKKK